MILPLLGKEKADTLRNAAADFEGTEVNRSQGKYGYSPGVKWELAGRCRYLLSNSLIIHKEIKKRN